MFTPWGKPNWSYMPILGGKPMNTDGGYGRSSFGGPPGGVPPSGGPPGGGSPRGGPEITIIRKDTKKINKHAKPMEEQVGVNKENTKRHEEPEEEIPIKNQPVEEDFESIGEGKDRTPPFLLTLEILNHKVHNCLVNSGSSVNVMSLTVCKKINGQPKPIAWEVTQLDRTNVKVVGEMENVLIR